MPKNIVILCDGTSNEIAANRTNVLRLYGCLEKTDEQVVFYDPGVGTFGAENTLSRAWRKTSEIWGLVTGWGLDQNVLEAYRFILDNYDRGDPEKPGSRDRIYILGFSRGAYTARVLAGFLRAIGLIDRTQLNLLSYAYRAYSRVGDQGHVDVPEARTGTPFAEVKLYERALRPYFPEIRCLGLFDTVSSVIEWRRGLPRLTSHALTSNNPSVEAIRHAVAIHERRVMFRPQLWPEGQSFEPKDSETPTPQDTKEVWFSGVHGDVGGGYPEADSALAKLPLVWLIEETRALGLAYKDDTVAEIVFGQNPETHHVPPDSGKPPQDSMKGLWPFVEFLPLPPSEGYGQAFLRWTGLHIPFFQDRVVPKNARIHRSVLENEKPLPRNVPEDHRVE